MAFARLTYLCECANLRFESLVVLPLDLKFRLELLDKQVQMGDFHAKFLDVCRCRSRSRRCVGRWLRFLTRLRGLTRDERFGQCARPGRFECRRYLRRGSNRAWRCGSRRRRKQVAQCVRLC